MFSAKHRMTVKGERSLVPIPFRHFFSHSLGHTVPDRERLGPELHEARFFHHRLVILKNNKNAMQMKADILSNLHGK